MKNSFYYLNYKLNPILEEVLFLALLTSRFNFILGYYLLLLLLFSYCSLFKYNDNKIKLNV